MPIMSTGDVKVWLGVTTTAYDSIITLLIPEVTERAARICGHWFETDLHVSTPCEYSAGSNVISAGVNWASYGFADDDDIVILGSYRNDGYHQVATVSGYTMSLNASVSTVVAELSGASTIIAVVKWPAGIKPVIANMIKYDYLQRPKNMGLQSESLGDYSYTLASGYDQAYGYPMDVIKGLSVYQRIRFI